ncbi:MAG: PaaI family thioesterase [Kofleriaceae bacterium]
MPDDKSRHQTVLRGFHEGIPHNKALGIHGLEIEKGTALFVLRYDEKLIGNAETGTIFGGAITVLLDTTSGAAVFAALGEYKPIATLDLRIDYMRAAPAGSDIHCRAHCYKVTKNVAFTRAVAYVDDEADPVATSAGTFMLGTKPGAK